MNRRTILKTTGAIAVAGLAAGGHATAQTDLPVEISQSPEAEYLTITNTGEEELDLTGYKINFDAEGGNDQIRELAGDVVLPAGGEVTIATGDETTIDTDYELADPYNGPVLNNDGTDAIALLDPEENLVAPREEPDAPEQDGDDDETDTGEDGGSDDDADDDESEDSSVDEADEIDDGTDDTNSEDAPADDSGSESDGEDECPEERDADGDGVVASEDADDDCAKIQ
ncbi:lamin tail domain-containing protein [Halalkalicoccus jeotgali]|uniref:lamin tail domain-containing protein n=1 Tax=Halalkalicoccus jeotgali TaxID=413810 RepID=UPI001EE63D84|nr:lamin tail domain-containing protein [Halalkalicoccus jeotgali]